MTPQPNPDVQGDAQRAAGSSVAARQDPAVRPHYPLGNALAFGGPLLLILIILIKFLYAIFAKGGTQNMPFLYAFHISTIQAIQADWLVFVLLFVHVIRVKCGILFLMYDSSYLAAGQRLGVSRREERVRNRFILFNALSAILISGFVLASLPCWVISWVLFLQALSIIAFDWYNRRQLFQEDVDRKSNMLVVAGDLGLLLLSVGILLYHLTVDPESPGSGLPSFLSAYFCLFAFAELELLLLLLAAEVSFTYRDGLRMAWRDFHAVLVGG